MNRYSIIIPARGMSDFLKESILYLKKLDYKNFEVIIVTDDQQTFDFGEDPRFKLISSNGNGSPCVKRNQAARVASGEILAFLDDDAYPTADWLTNADLVFSETQTYALGGPATTPPHAGFLEKMSGQVLQSWLASGNTAYRHTPKATKFVNDYPTVNLFVKKEAFNKIGGFDSSFWPGEDTKLCLDLVNSQGKNFIYDPRPVVFHHRRNLFLAHLKQISRYGKYRGQFAKIFPKSSRLPSYFIPTFFVLGLVCGLPLSFAWPILKTPYLLVLSLYIFLLLAESLKSAVDEKNLFAIPYVFFGIFLTHVVYGTNFLIGFIIQPRLKLKAVDKATGNYLEG